VDGEGGIVDSGVSPEEVAEKIELTLSDGREDDDDDNFALRSELVDRSFSTGLLGVMFGEEELSTLLLASMVSRTPGGIGWTGMGARRLGF